MEREIISLRTMVTDLFGRMAKLKANAGAAVPAVGLSGDLRDR